MPKYEERITGKEGGKGGSNRRSGSGGDMTEGGMGGGKGKWEWGGGCRRKPRGNEEMGEKIKEEVKEKRGVNGK